MRIAFTGSSSTGKSTTSRDLLQRAEAEPFCKDGLNADARQLLNALGHSSMDRMSSTECLAFQMLYFMEKYSIERGQNSFVTDRSFVDVASYWTVRDTQDSDDLLSSLLIEPCKKLAKQYDVHFLFSMGSIPFEFDGYRSNDMVFHQLIEERIIYYLKSWEIPYYRISTTSVDERVDEVLSVLNGYI